MTQATLDFYGFDDPDRVVEFTAMHSWCGLTVTVPSPAPVLDPTEFERYAQGPMADALGRCPYAGCGKPDQPWWIQAVTHNR